MSFDIRYHGVHPFRIVEQWIFTNPKTGERSGSENPEWVAVMKKTPVDAARAELAFYRSWSDTDGSVVTGQETDWKPVAWRDLRSSQIAGWCKVVSAFEMAEQLGYPPKCVEYFGRDCQ